MPSSPSDRLTLAARVRARTRALILLAIVLDPPLVARLAARLTRGPRVEAIEIDGLPVEIVRPAGTGPWPAWVFVNGAHPQRRNEPVVTRLSRGLARAGYLVVVPDLPGLGEGRITTGTYDAAVAVTRSAVALPDVRNGRVSLVGASMGAGLAILVAGRPELADRISFVAAIAPFADLSKLICLATTGSYSENGAFARHEITDLHRRVVARSLVALLSEGADRERLVGELERIGEEGDPLEHLREDVAELGAAAQAVVRLLVNAEPERFDELYQELPEEARSVLAALSPLAVCPDVQAPVEIVVPPSDVYFPPAEARSLAEALPRGKLTITGTLDHTRPEASLAGLAELRKLDGFVIRGLAAAA